MFNTTSMHLVTASEGIITLNCNKKINVRAKKEIISVVG